MKVKKAAALFLAGVMVFSTLAGCGAKGGSTTSTTDAAATDTAATDTKADAGGMETADAAATKYPRNEQGYPDLGGQTITIWHAMTTLNSQATNDMGEYKAIQELEKKFNVNLEFIHPPVGQEKDNFTIMMADGKLPDMIFCSGIDKFYPGGVETALADGVLFDYTEYITDENTPNFKKMMDEDEFFKKAVVDDVGRVIRLGAKVCGSAEADLTFSGPLIRKDYLEAAGLDVPTSMDDWTEMLKAFKENGVEFPLALDKGKAYTAENIFAAAYGIDGDGYFLKADGKVGYGPYEDAYKDYLTQLNSWYKAGYINPDFTTQTADEIMSLMSSDRVGSTLTHLYTYGVTYFVTTETQDETKALVAAPIPTLKEGDTLAGLRTSSRKLDDYKYITADAENKEACIALLDALYLKDIDTMLSYGTEGVTWEMQDGAPVALEVPADASKELLLSDEPQQFHTSEDSDLNYILTKKYNKGIQDEALQMWKTVGSENTISQFIIYSEEEAETIRSYDADIKTYVEEMTLKFIMGNEPLENFAAFQENLKNLHIEELIAVQQSASDRYMAR